MQVVLVYNPQSGSSLPLEELEHHFSDANIKIVDSVDISQGLARQLKPYLHQKEVIIAGYGGDGTLSSIAAELVNTSCVFAPLAGGTLNHFTKDLKIPQDLDEALTGLSQAKPRQIDMAFVNDRLFMNNSAIGLYPSMLQMRDEMTKNRLNKWSAAIIAGLRAFAHYRQYELEINNEKVQTPFVFVGNNDYQLEDSLLGERKLLSGGVLSVYAIKAMGRMRMLKVLLFGLFGQAGMANEIKIWKTKAVTIRTRRSHIRISRDGEHETISPPLHYRIEPKSLTIIGSS